MTTTIYEREMIKAKREARSFEGLRAPNSAWYLGSEKSQNGTTYNYYKDKDGNYYYDSDQSRTFTVEMQAAERRLRKKRWSA